jgi:hypothetical protein
MEKQNIVGAQLYNSARLLPLGEAKFLRISLYDVTVNLFNEFLLQQGGDFIICWTAVYCGQEQVLDPKTLQNDTQVLR